MGDFSFDLSGPLGDIPGNVFTALSIIINAVLAMLFAIYRRRPGDAATDTTSDAYAKCSVPAKQVLRRMTAWDAVDVETSDDKVNVVFRDNAPGVGRPIYEIEIEPAHGLPVYLYTRDTSAYPALATVSIDHLTRADRKALVKRAKELIAEREQFAQKNFDLVTSL